MSLTPLKVQKFAGHYIKYPEIKTEFEILEVEPGIEGAWLAVSDDSDQRCGQTVQLTWEQTWLLAGQLIAAALYDQDVNIYAQTETVHHLMSEMPDVFNMLGKLAELGYAVVKVKEVE